MTWTAQALASLALAHTLIEAEGYYEALAEEAKLEDERDDERAVSPRGKKQAEATSERLRLFPLFEETGEEVEAYDVREEEKLLFSPKVPWPEASRLSAEPDFQALLGRLEDASPLDLPKQREYGEEEFVLVYAEGFLEGWDDRPQVLRIPAELEEMELGYANPELEQHWRVLLEGFRVPGPTVGGEA